jgi:hypothetical protein
MKNLFLLLFALVFPLTMYAQFNVSLEGTGQWYVDDDKIKLADTDTSDRIRSNAFLKFGYALKNWDFGLQLESYYPKPLLNFSPKLHDVNIGSVHARYNNMDWGLDVTAGHIYEQFGSGLVFRTWEDRQLGINNAIVGGRIAYAPIAGAKLTVLGGKQRIGMGFDFSEGVVYAANLDLSFSELFSINSFDIGAGFSFVGRYEDSKALDPDLPNMVNAYAGRLNFGKGGFYVNGEFVYRDKEVLYEMNNILPNFRHAGNALLINLGYTRKGFGVDINLRRMENMQFYSQRDLAGNLFNTGVMNYIPALTKQYDHSLQNIYIYQAQPGLQFSPLEKNGEIGGQMDVFYEFQRGSFLGGKYGMNVSLNLSYWGGVGGEFEYMDRTIASDFFAISDKYYHDIGLEVRKRLSKNWSLIASYLNQFYSKRYVEDKIGEVNTNILTGEVTYKFGKAQSVKVEAQHHWADGGYKNWAGGAIEYALNYNWSFFVNDIYNYGNDSELQRIHFYNVGVNFVTGATRVAVSYGRQRGGLLCVGGVCRVVSEAAGLTLNISTSF